MVDVDVALIGCSSLPPRIIAGVMSFRLLNLVLTLTFASIRASDIEKSITVTA